MTRVERWEARSEWPLTAAAFAFLVAYAVPIVDPAVSDTAQRLCAVVVWVTWGLFVVDFAARVLLADRRWRYIGHHVLDLAVVALPLLRPLRLVRLAALVSVLNRTGARQLRGKVVGYAVAGATLLVVVGALAVTQAERGHAGATITGFGDGLWWAITTITTVGYGDTYPVTTTGRFVAAAVMIGGIALLGVITATLASWLVQRVDETTTAQQAATRAQVDDLAAEVRALRELLTQRGPTSDPPDSLP